jgi:hypothetical protein
MADQCKLWKPRVEARKENSFRVSRPPFWEQPQEWPKDQITKAMDFIILAGQRENIQSSRSTIDFILRRKLEEDMTWIENVMYQIEKLEVRMVEERIEVGI